MKNKSITSTLLATLFLLVSNICFAQKVEIDWGNVNENEHSNYYFDKIISANENGYSYFTRKIAAIGNIETRSTIFNNNLKHQTESSFELPEKYREKETIPRGVYKPNNEILAFYSITDKKAEIHSLHCFRIDTNGKVIEDKLVDKIMYKGRNSIGSFTIVYLKNQKKFFIAHTEGLSPKGNQEVNYKFYTENLSLTFDKSIEIPYNDNDFEVLSYLVDKNENIFLRGDLKKDFKLNKRLVFAFFAKTQKLQEVEITFNQASKVSNIYFTYEEGTLYFTGFYSDLKGGKQGVFVTRINATTLVTELEKTIPFSETDIALFIKKGAKPSNGITQYMYLYDVIIKENGEMFFIAEAYDTEVGNITKYYYKDIMVMSLSKDLKLDWVAKIPKTQVSTDDYSRYSSFIFNYDNANMYFIFNDNPQNLSSETTPEKKGKYVCRTTETSKSVINLTTLNIKTGTFANEVLPKPNNKIAIMPSNLKRINDNQFLLYTEFGRFYQFGILHINK